MNFVSRFVVRVRPQIYQSYLKCNILHFNTSIPMLVKYGKLINDHVTNAFYLPVEEGNNSEMAAVMYEQQKGLLNLHHTEVPEYLQGKGVGNDLAKEVFEYCSARNLKVLLTCEFLQKFYEENPKYKDLVVVREKMNV